MRNVTVGLIQMQCSDDPEANVRKAADMVEDAARQGAEIICLPELFRSRYFCKSEDQRLFDLAEPVPGPSTSVFEKLAARFDVALLVSLFEKRAEGLYHNTLAVLDGKRGFVGTYRKMHIPDDPLFMEKYYFTPGDQGFKVFDTPKARIGTLVCWDQWYPEAARLTALRGADILFYPTAIGWIPDEIERYGPEQHDAWETVQRAHAITNGCYVVAVNRTGFEPSAEREGIQFWGQSFVAAPGGSVIARGPVDQEAVLTVTLDLDQIEAYRKEWPFFRDRRIDAYGDLTRRFIDS